MTIEIRHGSIFDSKCDFIINTTNSIGIMGAGLAKEFASRYPIICREYNVWSKNINKQKPYRLLPLKIYGRIIMFPTKIDWRDPSEFDYLEIGLKQLKVMVPEDKSIAIPLLGARNGKLPADKVIELIKDKMKDHPSLVEIWKYNEKR